MNQALSRGKEPSCQCGRYFSGVGPEYSHQFGRTQHTLFCLPLPASALPLSSTPAGLYKPPAEHLSATQTPKGMRPILTFIVLGSPPLIPGSSGSIDFPASGEENRGMTYPLGPGHPRTSTECSDSHPCKGKPHPGERTVLPHSCQRSRSTTGLLCAKPSRLPFQPPPPRRVGPASGTGSPHVRGVGVRPWRNRPLCSRLEHILGSHHDIELACGDSGS